MTTDLYTMYDLNNPEKPLVIKYESLMDAIEVAQEMSDVERFAITRNDGKLLLGLRFDSDFIMWRLERYEGALKTDEVIRGRDRDFFDRFMNK